MNSPIQFFRIGPTDRVWIEGKAYRAARREGDGYIFVLVDDPVISRHITLQQLDRFMLSGELRVERTAYDPEAILARAHAEADVIGDLPVKERSGITRRTLYCTRFLELERDGQATRSDASMKKAITRIRVEIEEAEEAERAKRSRDGTLISARADSEQIVYKAPSPKTLRTSIKLLEAAGGRALVLRKRYRKCGDRLTARYPTEILILLAETAKAYGSEARSSVRTLYRKLKAAVAALNDQRQAVGQGPLRTPSYERLLKEVKELHACNVVAGRLGLSTAESDLPPFAMGLISSARLRE